jgi:hypothetical protein
MLGRQRFKRCDNFWKFDGKIFSHSRDGRSASRPQAIGSNHFLRI